MSLDSINPLGAKTPRLNQTNQVAPQRAVTAAPQTETGNKVADKAPVEGFKPSAEAKETINDQKAGEAKASEILGAWNGAGEANPVARAGELSVSGASNTNVNQVHGVSNGAYTSSGTSKPGFTEGTVYSTKPPTA
jgi:hypothetical protein